VTVEKSEAGRRHLQVACAIIEHDGLVLAAQRSDSMSLPLKWEFPGGKIHDGERPEECLARELFEELGVTVSVCEPLPPTTHHYPDFTVTLHPFRCVIDSGEITLHEHAAIRWLQPDRLAELDWAEADLPIIASLAFSRRSSGGSGLRP
jgi:8-oxo-dGTP diphosphatase